MTAPKPGERVLSLLQQLYGVETAANLMPRFENLLLTYAKDLSARSSQIARPRLSHKDSLLITYGDMVRAHPFPPLETLYAVSMKYLAGLVSAIHLLPFFPYSSDDGFSVIDYRRIDPALGSWQDVRRLSQDFMLMFDAVINHISAESAWFEGFLRGEPRYQDYFISVEGEPDLSPVVRPRTSPLLTPFETARGTRQVWTTFSADQIDLNYQNPEVLLEVIDLLLFYAAQGARLIRLDAIAFIWKQPGSASIHLPQAHAIVQLIRAVFDWVAPHMRIITETNVPHLDNLSYFGDGSNEAHLVYNFSLPPLVLHTFRTGDSHVLRNWAASLSLPSDQTTFFNFLASHDGIGLNPARGILPEAQIQALVDQAERHGGFVGYKTNPDGSRSPYELNINYYDALNDPQADEPLDLQVDRFICAQAIMLALVGVPGIYFHSLFGSRGWPAGVHKLGYNRAVNRRKLERLELEKDLEDPGSRRSKVFARYRRLLESRAASRAFDPHGQQIFFDCGSGILGMLRSGGPVSPERAVCLHNVTERPQTAVVDLEQAGIEPPEGARLRDLIARQSYNVDRKLQIDLAPYQVSWLAFETPV